MTQQIDEAAARQILEEQARAAHALALARAKAVQRHVDEKVPLMWALVEQETQTERRAADQANVEARLLTLTRGLLVSVDVDQVEQE